MTHFAMLPRGFESGGVDKATGGKGGVGELPERPVACAENLCSLRDRAVFRIEDRPGPQRDGDGRAVEDFFELIDSNTLRPRGVRGLFGWGRGWHLKKESTAGPT